MGAHRLVRLVAVVTLVSAGCTQVQAQQTLPASANCLLWDVREATGAVGDGGQDAFDTFGELHVETGAGFVKADNLDLAVEDGELRTRNPFAVADAFVARSVMPIEGTDILRFTETIEFTADTTVRISYGGNLGSDQWTALDDFQPDTWWVFVDGRHPQLWDPPVGVLIRDASDASFVGAGPQPGSEDGFGGGDQVYFTHNVAGTSGETKSVVWFLYRGLDERHNRPCGGSPPAQGSERTAARQALEGTIPDPPLEGVAGEVVNWDAEPACTIVIPDGVDRVYGTEGDDVICREERMPGDLTIWAYGGNDIVRAFATRLTVYGGEGNDRLEVKAGLWAHVYGDAGNDVIEAGETLSTAEVWAYGGPGHDTITGATANDILRGEGGDDVLIGGAGRDSAYGDQGYDICDAETRITCEG